MHRARPIRSIAELESKIETLTPEQVSQAFRKHVDPARLVIVEAGDLPPAR
jgi:zinc protease